ncbi:MAG: SMC-Scp complex subunit ScpB [Acidobacteria bacterium RIFCSPLOWO2_12_FULL_54_10]|nr:MAG: SMC-Scp complex subunit ScpB [Acidobacteria bacterium RIFCSPLOWO2_12_FULL_54_10]
MDNLKINPEQESSRNELKAAVEAIVYVADEPVTPDQIAASMEGVDRQQIIEALQQLQREYQHKDRGIEIVEVAGGYKMFTKAEHHEVVRTFVKNLTPPLKLSMAALETLATIAYRQPITLPEIQQIRGVNASGTVKTLLDRKLVTTAGRKDVIGRPILYKTTKEFLVQFGLNNVHELPSIQEFEELARSIVVETPTEPSADPTPGLEFPATEGNEGTEGMVGTERTEGTEPDYPPSSGSENR